MTQIDIQSQIEEMMTTLRETRRQGLADVKYGNSTMEAYEARINAQTAILKTLQLVGKYAAPINKIIKEGENS